MTHLLSPEHLLTLVVVAAAIAGLTGFARRLPLGLTRALAGGLIANQAAWQVYLLAHGAWTARQSVPVDLCDQACLVAAAALWTRRPVLVEITWFWALAGTLQALITPDTGAWHFPQFLYIQYYAGHALIVAAAFVLVIGLGIHPRRGAWGRVVLGTLGATVVAGIADRLTGGDYMFLVSPPADGSLLSLLGPWPLYLIPAAALALGLFWLLQLPFALEARHAA